MYLLDMDVISEARLVFACVFARKGSALWRGQGGISETLIAIQGLS